MKKILFILAFFMACFININATEVDDVNNFDESKYSIVLNNDSLLMYDKCNFAPIYEYLELDLNDSQFTEFYFIHTDIYNSIKYLANHKEEGVKYFNKRIYKDLYNCNYILDKNQYHKYLLILNVTLNNNGLMDYIIEYSISNN